MKKIVFLALLPFLFSCQKEVDRSALIDQFLQSQVQFQKFNGNVLVAEKGKVVYQRSFGYSNFDTKELLNDTTVFELASVSKQFTAMGILLLEKQGKLSLEDSLRKFFPQLPYHNITVHQLLAHTSGLPEYEDLMSRRWDKKKIAFNNDMIDVLVKEKPGIYFKPGTKWDYSNTGYALLASIIEKVSGLSYRDFLAKNILEPLEMKHSRVYNTRRSGEKITNYAFGYVWSDSLSRFVLPDSLKKYDFVFPLDGIVGDGTVNSTTGDLLKWENALVNKTLLGEATTEKMLHEQAVMDTVAKSYYGYGVMIATNELGKLAQHSGGWPGYVTMLTHYFDADRTIIVLSNNESSSVAIANSIANILFGKLVEPAYEHKAITYDSTAMVPFTGAYTLRTLEFELAPAKDHVSLTLKNGQHRKFIPESPTKLFAANGSDVAIERVTDASGNVKYFRTAYGVREEMKKK